MKTVIRSKKVLQRTGLTPSTMYYFINEGTFPKPIKLGLRSVGWLEHEIDEWITGRVEKRDQKQEVMS